MAEPLIELTADAISVQMGPLGDSVTLHVLTNEQRRYQITMRRLTFLRACNDAEQLLQRRRRRAPPQSKDQP